MSIPPEVRAILKLFFPAAVEARERMERDNVRFVHYTTAEAAISMLTHKEVWMRNAVVMNDFSEISHGRDCVFAAYQSDAGKALQAFMNKKQEGLTKKLEETFNGWLSDIGTNTYITSLSEHKGGMEDRYGRLSMWRAYGRGPGVALVLNNEAFKGEEQSINVYSDAVFYATPEQFTEQFSVTVRELLANPLIAEIPPDDLMAYVFDAFRSALIFTKHPAFIEEAEWRIIYSPNYEASDIVVEDHKVLHGIPQTIYKLPLKNPEGKGVKGWDIPELLDRIIVGPTEFALPIVQELTRLLKACGIEKPHERIVVSGVPLRTDG